MANDIILSRQHKIFCAAESTPGTLVYPAATDLVIPAGNGTISQVPSYTDSEEIKDSRSLMDQFEDARPAGKWQFPMYLRPDSTLGNKPQAAAVFKALFGQEAVNAGTSVVYSLASSLPSLSMWVKYGDVVLFAAGATVDQMQVGVTRKGAVKLTMSGGFMYMGWCGVSALSAAIDGTGTPVTSIPVVKASRFVQGCHISIGNDDNGGAGYEVTDVDTSTNTLTISPGCDTAQSSGAEVKAVLPAGTEVGSPVEMRKCSIQLDGVDKKLMSIDCSVVNNIKYLEEEISDQEYPTAYIPDRRAVSGKLGVLFREDDLDYFALGYAGTENALSIIMGDSAGHRATLAMPRTRLTVPDVNPQSPTVQLSMDFTSLGQSGEDEVTLTFD